MVSNIARLLIFLLLVNIVFGLNTISNNNRRSNHLLKRRSMENDNEYVWFTRDIHNDMDDDNEEMKRNQFQKQQVLSRSKFINNIHRRKYPFVEDVV